MIEFDYPDSTRELLPIIKSWLECREHAFRALRAGQLRETSKPVEFLRWAESLGYPIPKGLQGLFGGSEAQTKLAINVTPPVSAVTLKQPKRANVLSPLINQAIEDCGENTEWASVWNKLVSYSKDPREPLVGLTDSGLKYETQQGEHGFAFLTKDALRKRLKRINSPAKSR